MDVTIIKQWIKKDSGRLLRSEKTLTVFEVMQMLRDSLPSFLFHMFIKSKQANYRSYIRQHLPRETILFLCDFKENFNMERQDEI